MKISKALHLVIPVTRGDGSRIYVHSTPISSEVFDAFYRPIAKANAEITSGGYGLASGPRIAAKLLRDAAKNLGMWDGPAGAERGLIGEINRLTNVLAPHPQKTGWDTVPLESAIAEGLLATEDAEEVRNAVSFFSCGYHMFPRTEMKLTLEAAASLWGAQISLLDCTEYRKSLAISTATASTGATVAA